MIEVLVFLAFLLFVISGALSFAAVLFRDSAGAWALSRASASSFALALVALAIVAVLAWLVEPTWF